MEIPRPSSKPPLGRIPLEAGAWTEIISLSAPSAAAAGSQVSVVVKVKNLATYGIYIAVTGVFDSTEISFTPDYASVDAGATYSFNGSFTMPSKKVTVTVYSFYWIGTEWHQDDQKSVSIDIQAVWVTVASTTLAVDVETEVAAWVTVVTATLSVAVEAEVAVWVTVTTATLAVDVEVVTPEGWVIVATATLTIDIGAVPGDFTNLKVAYSKA